MMSKAYIVSIVTLFISQNTILAAPSSYDSNSATNRRVLDNSDILRSNNDAISPFVQNKEAGSKSNPINSSNISKLLRGTSKPGFEVADVLRKPSSAYSGDKLSYKRPSNYKEKNTSKTVGPGSAGLSSKKKSKKSPGISHKGSGSNKNYKQKTSTGTESPENEIVIDRYKEPSGNKGKTSTTKQYKGKLYGKHGVSKKRPGKSIGGSNEIGYKRPLNKKNNSHNSQTIAPPNGNKNGNGFPGKTKPKTTKPSKFTKPGSYKKRPTLNYRRPRPTITRPKIRPGLNYRSPDNDNHIRPDNYRPFKGNNGRLKNARPGENIGYARPNPGQVFNPYRPSKKDDSFYTYRRP